MGFVYIKKTKVPDVGKATSGVATAVLSVVLQGDTRRVVSKSQTVPLEILLVLVLLLYPRWPLLSMADRNRGRRVLFQNNGGASPRCRYTWLDNKTRGYPGRGTQHSLCVLYLPVEHGDKDSCSSVVR